MKGGRPFIGASALADGFVRVLGADHTVCGLVDEFRTSKNGSFSHAELTCATSTGGPTRLSDYKLLQEQKEMIRKHGFDAVWDRALGLEVERLQTVRAAEFEGRDIHEVRASVQRWLDSGPTPWIQDLRRKNKTARLLRRLVVHEISAAKRVSEFRVSSIWRRKQLTTASPLHCSAGCPCLGRLEALLREKLTDASESGPSSQSSVSTKTQTCGDKPLHVFYVQRDLSGCKSIRLRRRAERRVARSGRCISQELPYAFLTSKERKGDERQPPPGRAIVGDLICQ